MQGDHFLERRRVAAKEGHLQQPGAHGIRMRRALALRGGWLRGRHQQAKRRDGAENESPIHVPYIGSLLVAGASDKSRGSVDAVDLT